MLQKHEQELPDEKSEDTSQVGMVLRRRYNIPPMSKAIRLNCLECVCGASSEVRLCAITTCPLWPYRLQCKTILHEWGACLGWTAWTFSGWSVIAINLWSGIANWRLPAFA